MDEAKIATFQKEIGAMGYKFQFVTLAGFHSLNHGMFELAKAYGARGMAAYSELQTVSFFFPSSVFLFFFFCIIFFSLSSPHSFSFFLNSNNNAYRPSSPPRRAAIPRPSTSARSAPATSTPSRPLCPLARRRRWRSRARPRPRSSTRERGIPPPPPFPPFSGLIIEERIQERRVFLSFSF